MKGSETTFIKRSQINLNPYNPKSHSDEEIKLQKKNIKKVGYLGGVIWNEATGNLVDGHRRIQAMDQIYKYDGTPETDYEVKVERVDMDDKTEKEQMTYQAVGNSKADYNLIARYIGDIDAKEVGLSDADIKAIGELNANLEEMYQGMETVDDFIAPVEELPVKEELTNDDIVKIHEEKPKMTREEVRAQKEHCDNVAVKNQGKQDLYIVVQFRDEGGKAAFCEALGLDMSNNMIVSGEDILSNFDF